MDYQLGGLSRIDRSLPGDLEDARQEIERIASGYGLDFFETAFVMCTYDEINMLAAYGGFPIRYPHWRFGMEYLEMQKGYEWGLQKIYEMVINTDPSYAYLMDNNATVDQKLVMAHVFGHVDFFKNNAWFRGTNRKMLDTMANHATRVRRYIDRFGESEVEQWIDVCLSIDNLIDPHSVHIRRERRVTDAEREAIQTDDGVRRLRAEPHMDKYINPPEFLEQQRQQRQAERDRLRSFPEEPQRDVLLFLLRHAEMPAWKHDVLNIIRDESYYFAPQAQTKVMNEGWACIHPESLVYSENGVRRMREIVEGVCEFVYDGEQKQRVYDRNIIPDHPTVKIRTRRGLVLEGSNNHRVLLNDGETWRRLDELEIGDGVSISGGGGMWPKFEQLIGWLPKYRMTLADVADLADVSVRQVVRYRQGLSVHEPAAIAFALRPYETEQNLSLSNNVNRRARIRVPKTINPDLGAFLGYLVGDGHISRAKHHLGLTSGDHESIETFIALSEDLFGLTPSVKKDGTRWRALIHAEHLSDFLIEYLGLTYGPSAARKKVPERILHSPEPVVRAFLRAYFDCDAYAGKQGVILSTSSEEMAQQVQLLLMNYGILSRVRQQTDGCYHLHVAGASAKRYAERVGFGLARKTAALDAYLSARKWFKPESWTDEVVSIEHGRADVYDISVEETHRYAAGGFINHNSYWHTRMMTHDILSDAEVVDYCDHHAGTVATRPGQFNPYKIGLELYRDIERRWDRGQFGRNWADCQSYEQRRRWDTGAMLGRKKIFEVRQIHNDVTFIDEFLTEDFVRTHGLFTWEYDKKKKQYVIDSREFQAVKQKLLFMLSNRGQPRMLVVNGNHANRGELVLRHDHEGPDIQLQWAEAAMKNLARVWGRPVHIETAVDGRKATLHHDGDTFSRESTGPARKKKKGSR